MTIIFDGKKIAKEKETNLKLAVEKLKSEKKITPKLAAILVGDDPASQLYVFLKQKAAARVGIEFSKYLYPADINPEEVLKLIKNLNEDPKTHGILIQLPFPKNSLIFHSQFSIINYISPTKDVDCLTAENFGRLAQNNPLYLPATVQAIISILENINIKNSNVCVVGSSLIVGKPLAFWLSNHGATVTLCRSNTNDLNHFTSTADILISATGKPNLITAEMVKPDAVVIDVGSPKGDVDFENVKKVTSFITPVPGGIGPLTVISLLENTLKAV